MLFPREIYKQLCNVHAEPSLHDWNVEVSDATKYRSEDLTEIGEDASPPGESACMFSELK